MEAFVIMALGMGGVFLFLILVIFVMQAIVRYLPFVEPPKKVVKKSGVAIATSDNQLIAVLQAAVVAYEADK